jgi:hypothetical protein
LEDEFIISRGARQKCRSKRKVPILRKESTGTCESTRLGFDGATKYFAWEHLRQVKVPFALREG